MKIEWAQAAPWLAIDFETFYDESQGYSIGDMGYSAYVNDSRFSCSMVAISDGENAHACPPDAFPWAILHGKPVVAHNAGFDEAVFRRLWQLGKVQPPVEPAQWDCTASMCAYLGHPRALDASAKLLLGLTLDKSQRSAMSGGADLFHDDAAWAKYAADDALACAKLWAKYSPHWPEHERALARLTFAMGRRGVRVAWDKAQGILEGLEDQAESARLTLPWYPRQKPTSPKALAAYCERHGVPVPDSTATKDDAFSDWLAAYGNTEPARAVRAMQEIRSLNRAAKLMETIKARRRLDDRIDASTLYFGAATGRWSGGGHGLNLQNLNRNDAGLFDVRGCIIASPGNKLVIVDLSQIEPRCLAWMAGDAAWLDLVRNGFNPYEAHAMTAHGWKGKKLKHEDSRLYALCKAERLGLGYGCGADKFVVVAKTLAGLDVEPAEAAKIVREFRATNRAIVQLWDRCEQAFKRCHGGTYRMPLPSSRVLRYFTVDADRMTAATCRGEAPEDWYGGKLTENLIQAMARDVFAEGLLRCEEAGLNPILTVHDEIVCEVPDYCAKDALEAIIERMTAPPLWAPDLPVGAEGCISDFYRK